MTPVEKLRLALEKESGIRMAVLFGSAARGVATPRSDLDVGLLLDDSTRQPAMLAAELGRATGRNVDVVWLDTAPPLLRFEIARDGVLLSTRDPHAWAAFRAQAMIDWWDWAPTARMMHRTMRERLREEASHGPA